MKRWDKLIRPFAPIALAVFGFTGVAAAQPSSPSPQPQRQQRRRERQHMSAHQRMQLARRDLAALHAINQVEANLGLLAINRSPSPDVRDFAAKLSSDHAKADRQLAQTANALGIELVNSPQSRRDIRRLEDRLHLRRIERERGAAFDRAFLAVVVASHESALKELRRMQQSAVTEQVKNYIGSVMSDFQGHLQEAQALQQKLEGGAPQGKQPASR